MKRIAKARAAHLFICTERLFQLLQEEDDEFPLTDDDIRAAVSIWLNTPPWRQRLKIVDEMSAGSLRSFHENLPQILLDSTADEGVSSSVNAAEEASAALEYSEYFDIRGGIVCGGQQRPSALNYANMWTVE